MSGPLRVGNAIYSWTSSLYRFDGRPFANDGTPWGLTSLDYADKRERKVVFANRLDGRPVGKTSGKYTVEPVTIKMLKAGSMALQQYLAIDGAGSSGDTQFQLMVQVAEPAPGARPLVIDLEECTIDGIKDGYEEGVDELLDEITIGCLYLRRNGISLYSLIRGLQQGSP